MLQIGLDPSLVLRGIRKPSFFQVFDDGFEAMDDVPFARFDERFAQQTCSMRIVTSGEFCQAAGHLLEPLETIRQCCLPIHDRNLGTGFGGFVRGLCRLAPGGNGDAHGGQPDCVPDNVGTADAVDGGPVAVRKSVRITSRHTWIVGDSS